MNKDDMNMNNNQEPKFYPMMLKDRVTVRELLPKVEMNMMIMNVMNVDETGEFDEGTYEAILGLIRLAIREPEATKESIESWLNIKNAGEAIRTLLGLPLM